MDFLYFIVGFAVGAVTGSFFPVIATKIKAVVAKVWEKINGVIATKE